MGEGTPRGGEGPLRWMMLQVLRGFLHPVVGDVVSGHGGMVGVELDDLGALLQPC